MTEGSRPPAPRDEEAVRRFVEQIAMQFADWGFPRMAGRVLFVLMTADEPGLSAAELGDRLDASAAAISGAVRYLTQVHLVVREREPGEKRDHYRVRGSSWYESAADRERLLVLWSEALTEGVAAVGEDSEAGARLRESVEFFDFLRVEIPLVLDRWRSRNVAN